MSAHRTVATLVRCALAASGLLLPALAPRALQAQAGSGTLAATTEILLPGVTGTGDQLLRFGQVTAGQTVNVPPGPAAADASVSSAGWHFGNIRKGRVVSLALTLPSKLSLGSSSIPINWNNANYALICAYGASGICDMSASYNPGAQPNVTFTISNAASGTMFDVRFYAGAKITVPSGLPPGTYTAVVTAAFAYVN